MAISIKIGGLQATLDALSRTAGSVDQIAQKALDSAGKEMARAVRLSMGLQDHTLAQLAAMDHPYAKRHGGIQIHQPRSWRVHRQTGTLLNAVKDAPSPGNYRVWVDMDAAPHARYVIQGTKVMHGRDVLWEASTDPATKRAMKIALVKTLGAELRTKSAVRLS